MTTHHISRCESLCRGFPSPTPERLSLNSRGCARPARTPGNGTRNACHPGGVVPSTERLDGLVPGEPLRGSRALRRESGGVARASLHPRLFTVNPSGVRPWDTRDTWVRACLKTRPVRAPGLQATGFSAKACRPRALTRRFPRVFKPALSLRLRGPRLAMVLPGRETTGTVQTARTFAKTDSCLTCPVNTSIAISHVPIRFYPCLSVVKLSY